MKRFKNIAAKNFKRCLGFVLAVLIALGSLPVSLWSFADGELTLDGSGPVTYELENGSFSGSTVTAGTAITGFSGTGYAGGFTSAGSSVSFDVNVTKMGIYGLTLRSAQYLQNHAIGSAQTSNQVQGSGNGSVTDGNEGSGSMWYSGTPVNADNPRWLQINLGRIIPVHVVRVRIPARYGSRTETFEVLGSTDGENFTTLKGSAVHSFVKGASDTDLSGNYVDINIEPTELQYIKLNITAVSDTGSNGAQISEIEVYSPIRTAELHLDGAKISEFTLAVDSNNIVNAAWDTHAVLSWASKEIGEIALSSGVHTITIKNGGALAGGLNLDNVIINFKSEINDTAVIDVMNKISAIPPLYQITAASSEQIGAANTAYNALAAEKKAFVPTAFVEKLLASVTRISLISDTVGLSDLVCNDGNNTGGWKILTDMQIGDLSHGDRTFSFNYIPSELWGCDWIRSAMDSKTWSGGSTLVSFKVNVDTVLYVAFDRSATAPTWLTSTESGFTKTSMYLNINNTDNTMFDLYKKTVSAGDTISLGAMGQNKATYLVLLEHFTTVTPPLPPESTIEYPALDNLTVNDAANASLWSVEQGLALANSAYSGGGQFTEIPEMLLGGSWIKPAAVSGAYNGASLASVTVNRDGYLYLAVSDKIAAPSFVTGYEKTAAVIKVGTETYALYRKRVDAGTTVVLPAQNDNNPCYIAILKTNAITESPDVPAISRFVAPFDTDGWYFVRSGLTVGGKLFTSSNAAVTELPDIYKGCDYIQTYNGGEKFSLYFYAERDIEVAVTVDGRFTTPPSWLTTWTDTGKTIKTADRTYNIYTKNYTRGTFVTVPKLADTSNDNYIVIVRPTDTGKDVTNNPVVPQGNNTASEPQYKYYASDVFSGEDGTVPSGYTVKSGEAKIASSGTAVLTDLAFRRPYTYSSATNPQYMHATDGLTDSYWESIPSDTTPFIAVNLGSVKSVASVVLKLKPLWGKRTQTFSIDISANGTDWTTAVASKSYEFLTASKNVVTVDLPGGSTAAYVRLSFTGGNSAAPGAQISEFQVFGTESGGVNKFVNLKRTDDKSAVLEKSFASSKPTGQIVAEFSLKSSSPDRESSVSLINAAGVAAVNLKFGRDGYIYATNAAATSKIGYYKADTWYVFKLVINLDSGAYEVWIDHLRVADGLKTGATGAVETLCFTAADEKNTLSIDNVAVYDNPERYLFTEDFNASTSVPSGWTVSDTNKASVADVPFASDKSLLLVADGKASKATRTLPATSGLFTFEVKVKPVGIGFAALPILTDAQGKVAAGAAFYHNNLYAINGDNWVKVMDGDSPWAYYPANNWYKVTFVINTTTKRYDLYIDGALRMSGLSFAEDVASVSKASFTLGAEGAVYIDSLVMYMGSSLQGGLIDTANVINVKNAPYNAKGDGVTDDTVAIQRALDDAAYKGKTVLLENGVFLTSKLQVRSDTTLHVSPNAKILGVMEKTYYPLIESCDGYNNHHQVGRGLILTENASNVRIEGGGTIDGNGFYGYRVNDPPANDRITYARPCVILSVLSENVTIQNVNLINSAFWTLVPMESRNVTIRNVNVNSMNTPNRDGIDPVDVINLTIENCNILAGDDGLCFKSSNSYGCENIDVRNITIQSRSNGIKFGTDTYWSLKNLTVTDVTMKNVVRAGIAIESVDGAEVENLRFERVTMTEVDDPIFLCVGERGRQPNSNPGKRIGYIRDVVFKDISFTDAMMPPHSIDADVHEILIVGLDAQHKISNVAFENVYMEMPGGYTTVPGIPGGIGGGYPEHSSAGKSNAWAYCIKYADNVTFKNCVNVLQNDDAREEIKYNTGYGASPVAHDKAVRYILPTRVTANVGTPTAELGLPSVIDVVLDYGVIMPISVKWTAPDDYNPEVGGEYEFVGSLTKTDGISNTLLRLKASAIVTLTEDAVPEPITAVSVAPITKITVPYGTAYSSLGLPATVEVTMSDGTKKTVGITWSEGGYTPNTAGTYTLNGTLDLSEAENPSGLGAAVEVEVGAKPETPLEKAKSAIEGKIPTVAVTNATTADALLAELKSGVDGEFTLVWETPFAITAATKSAAGKITGSLKLTVDGEDIIIPIDITVPKLESKGLSGGQVALIVIGSVALIGAVVGGTLFLLYKKKKWPFGGK